MVLSEVRALFIELSGREDLLQPGTAVGADFFINEGSRELDRRHYGINAKTTGRYPVDLDVGQILIPLPSCRAVKKVFIYSASEKTELVKASDVSEIRNYYDEPKANKTSGSPIVYYPINARPFPGTISISSYNQTWAFEDIMEDGHEGFNSILISPPPDSPYTMIVEGLFYSDELVNEGDYNRWTIEHPLTLVHASLFKLEQTYRNTEGAKDWEAAMDAVLDQLNADIVEEEIEGVNYMEG
jgi:hypothetical protein